MFIAKEVNRVNRLVTIDGDDWTITLVNGKVRASMGRYLTPVENRKVHKIYNSIINKK